MARRIAGLLLAAVATAGAVRDADAGGCGVWKVRASSVCCEQTSSYPNYKQVVESKWIDVCATVFEKSKETRTRTVQDRRWQDRSYTIQQQVCETHYRDEMYDVQRPVYHTEYVKRSAPCSRVVCETHYRDQSFAWTRPVYKTHY